MRYRTVENVLVAGSFLLLLISLIPPSLVARLRTVTGISGLQTHTVAAATLFHVWTVKKTGWYYCPDSRLYGKVKPGADMSEEEALQRGYRPAGGYTCR
jgi:hypothetical protein